MGRVAITFKIMPRDVKTDLFKVKDEIAKKIKVQDYVIEDVAFGLKILKVLIVTEDTGTEDIENEIKSIKDVSEVEIESSTLL